MQKTLFTSLIAKRTFGTSSILRKEAAAAAVKEAPPPLPPQRSKPPTDLTVKSTRTPNGLFVVSLDNGSPLSRVCAIFRAGTRYETSANEGVVHRLRNACGLKSKNYSAITINYETAYQGGLLECSSSRDFLSYTVQCNRQNIIGALESSFSEMLVAPDFRFYELDETLESLKIDHATLRENFTAYVIEMLHKVAYRTGGLSRSLISPSRMIGKHSEEMCHTFFDHHVVASNGALVGLGVDHELLVGYATELFELPKGSPATPAPSKYFGGGELRKERGGDLSVVVLAGEGVSLHDPKAVATQAVLAYALGAGPNVKWNDGAARLPKAVRGATGNPFLAHSVSLNYTDSGLFGVLVVCDSKDSNKVTKAAYDALKNASSISDADLKAAKAKATFDVLDKSVNCGQSLIEDLAVQTLLKQGQYSTAPDVAQLINGVTASDVGQIAKKVIDSKISMAAIGNLDNTPYLDELSSSSK